MLRNTMMNLAEFEAFVRKRFTMPENEDEEATWGMLPEQEESFREVKAFHLTSPEGSPDVPSPAFEFDGDAEECSDDDISEAEGSDSGSDTETERGYGAQSVSPPETPLHSPPDTPQMRAYSSLPDAPEEAVSPLDPSPPLPLRMLPPSAPPPNKPLPPTPVLAPPTIVLQQGLPTPIERPSEDSGCDRSLPPTPPTPRPPKKLPQTPESPENSVELPDLPVTPRTSPEPRHHRQDKIPHLGVTPATRRALKLRPTRAAPSPPNCPPAQLSGMAIPGKPVGRAATLIQRVPSLSKLTGPRAPRSPLRSNTTQLTQRNHSTSRGTRPTAPLLTIPNVRPLGSHLMLSPLSPLAGESPTTPKAEEKTPTACVSSWERASLAAFYRSASPAPTILHYRRPEDWVSPVTGTPAQWPLNHKRSASAPEQRRHSSPISPAEESSSFCFWQSRPVVRNPSKIHREASVHMTRTDSHDSHDSGVGLTSDAGSDTDTESEWDASSDAASDRSRRCSTILGKVDYDVGRDQVALVTGLTAQQQQALEDTLDEALIEMLQDTVREMLECRSETLDAMKATKMAPSRPAPTPPLPPPYSPADVPNPIPAIVTSAPPQLPLPPVPEKNPLRWEEHVQYISSDDEGIVRGQSPAKSITIHEVDLDSPTAVDLSTPTARFSLPLWRKVSEEYSWEELEAEWRARDSAYSPNKRLEQRPRGPRGPRTLRQQTACQSFAL